VIFDLAETYGNPLQMVNIIRANHKRIGTLRTREHGWLLSILAFRRRI
jgi:hypothetical protein